MRKYIGSHKNVTAIRRRIQANMSQRNVYISFGLMKIFRALLDIHAQVFQLITGNSENNIIKGLRAKLMELMLGLGWNYDARFDVKREYKEFTLIKSLLDTAYIHLPFPQNHPAC